MPRGVYERTAEQNDKNSENTAKRRVGSLVFWGMKN